MQSELGCVRRRSNLVQQRRRAFDVGEEERDGACWPFWHGNRIAVRACSRKRLARAGRLASASVTALLAHAPTSDVLPLLTRAQDASARLHRATDAAAREVILVLWFRHSLVSVEPII